MALPATALHLNHTGKVDMLDQCCSPDISNGFDVYVGAFAACNSEELTSRLSRSSARTSVSRRALGLLSGMLEAKALERR